LGGFHSPRKGCLSPTGKTGHAAKQQKFKIQKRHRHASMPVAFLNFELSSYTSILFFLSGASFPEAAKMKSLQRVR